MWEEFGEAMEEDLHSATAKFWQIVCGSGEESRLLSTQLLTSTDSIVRQWKEYFEDLLNPTNTHSEKEAEAGGIWAGLYHYWDQGHWDCKQHRSISAPGANEIHPERLKTHDVIRLS